MNVICPYCQTPAELTTGTVMYPHRPDLATLKFWHCKPCDAYVGCHRSEAGYGNGTRPLGRLANATLRRAKMAAHAAINPLWREGRLRRSEVYSTLAILMNLGTKEAHIGEFDEEQCAKAVKLGNNALLWERTK